MKIFIVVIALIVLTAIGYFFYKGNYNKPSQSTNSTSFVSTNSVNISNFSFDPANITVKAGSIITFTNNDGTDHTVTDDNGNFDQSVSSGQTTTITISNPGTYSYHCKIHSSMKGTIIVQ